MSGSYQIDGTELIIQPTLGRWMPRSSAGITGDGHAIYAGVREYEMRWQLNSASGYNQLMNYFEGIDPTGTAVVDLPRFAFSNYEFFSYSGCVLREPETGPYFTQNNINVILLVSNIRT